MTSKITTSSPVVGETCNICYDDTQKIRKICVKSQHSETSHKACSVCLAQLLKSTKMCHECNGDLLPVRPQRTWTYVKNGDNDSYRMITRFFLYLFDLLFYSLPPTDVFKRREEAEIAKAFAATNRQDIRTVME